MYKIKTLFYTALFIFSALPGAAQERIDISLDRDLYIAGETIDYRAGYFQDQELRAEPLSKVLYIEIITNTGQKIAQTKSCFFDRTVSGKLQVPEAILSGNYYFRAYTKYMRNHSPETYSYQLITIVNPFTGKVLQDVEPVDTGAKDPRTYQPEINGLTISGQIITAADQEPVEGAEISISTVSDASYFSIVTSDPEGNFVFELPWDLENTEFTISVDGYDQSALDILVDSEYCNKKVQMEYIPFTIKNTSEVLEQVHQYQKEAHAVVGKPENTTPDPAVSFYGAPGRVIYEKDYIDLNSIGSFVYELIYEFKYSGSARYLYPTGNFSLKYSPVLVLIDNVRVYDIETFLQLPARSVKKFEIIRGGYIIGEKRFGGILNVVTEERDMAGYVDQAPRIYFEFSTACQYATTTP